jgi:hypothetical protein
MPALPQVLLYGRTVDGVNVPVLVDATGLLAGGGNPFDQNLNVADSPTFAALTLAGKLASYNGVTTSGWGIPVIQKAARATAQIAANASVATYTNGAADGSFEVSANVLVTASATHSFSVTCAYTDEGNSSRTATLSFLLVAGTALTTLVANGNGTVPYMGLPLHIRCKASTSITIATSGTFTSVTYNVDAAIKQLA